MVSNDAPVASSRGLPATRTVLVVDDDATTRALLVRWLTGAGLTCVEATNGETALELAATHAGVLESIVLDVVMPGIDGHETMKRLKQNPLTALIPIVLLTAHATDERDIVRGVEAGAIDYVVKPFSGPILVAKVRAMCERAHSERELRRKLSFAEANATIDALTRLSNRRSFESRLREEGAYAKRHQLPLSLIMIDIDHFKQINDTFGHEDGDRVLVHVADAMRSILRQEDSAFRYGGEEFVLLLRAVAPANGARAAERLRASLKERKITLGEPHEQRSITFSAGVAAADAANGYATEDLVARADVALYRAKRSGRDRVEIATTDGPSRPPNG